MFKSQRPGDEIHECGETYGRLFVDFDKKVDGERGSSECRKADECSVAKAAFVGYAASSGMKAECLREFEELLEFDRDGRNVVVDVHKCECGECEQFLPPTVFLYTSHRDVKCSIHVVVVGEHRPLNARMATLAFMAGLAITGDLEGFFVYSGNGGQKRFAFDSQPFTTKSLRVLGSCKDGGTKGEKILSDVYSIHGKMTTSKHKEDTAANHENSLVFRTNELPWKAEELHPTVQLLYQDLCKSLKSLGIPNPTLPGVSVSHLITPGDQTAPENKSQSYTDTRENTQRIEQLVRQAQLVTSTKLGYPLGPMLSVTTFTSNLGLGFGGTHEVHEIETACKRCPWRPNGDGGQGGKHTTNTLHLRVTPYSRYRNIKGAVVAISCRSHNHVIGCENPLIARIAPGDFKGMQVNQGMVHSNQD